MKSGFRQIQMGLTADTYFEALDVKLLNKANNELMSVQPLSEEELEEVLSKASGVNMYDKLAQSIAPEIYGHLDVKKALLLMLVRNCCLYF